MPNPSLATTGGVLTDVGIASVITLIVSLVKPFLEQWVPIFNPTNSLHDSSIQVLQVLVNIALQFALVAMAHSIQATDVMPAIMAGLLQSGWSEGTYKTLTRAGLSVNKKAGAGATVAPPPLAPPPDPAPVPTPAP